MPQDSSIIAMVDVLHRHFADRTGWRESAVNRFLILGEGAAVLYSPIRKASRIKGAKILEPEPKR